MEMQNIIRQFNEILCKELQKNIYFIEDFKYVEPCRNMLCLCTGVYNKVEALVEMLSQLLPTTHLIIIGREKIVNALKNIENTLDCSWVIWEKEFSTSILTSGCFDISLDNIDGMVFLCRDVNDLRDFNLFEIAAKLRSNSKIFGSIGGEQLVQYTDLEKYVACLKCYDAVMQWVNACVEK